MPSIRRKEKQEERQEQGRHSEGAEQALMPEPWTEAAQKIEYANTLRLLRERGDLWRLIG